MVLVLRVRIKVLILGVRFKVWIRFRFEVSLNFFLGIWIMVLRFGLRFGFKFQYIS
jgi:hypothetical protein